MIIKKTKIRLWGLYHYLCFIVVIIILITLFIIGLTYLDNYLTPKFGSCYDNRNRIPHHHVGPCNTDNW